ncbi:MAG: aldo/keto reductase [Euryarchaeota archaeon]|nr:aldo/keto reductase [Euryarchaeota archaeon]
MAGKDRIPLAKTGIQLSPIGLGTWQWGAKEWGWGGTYGEKEVLASLDKSLELGVNWVDTAEIYGMGRSEELLGRGLKGRNEVFIASKVAPLHDFEKACERSRKRLQVDVIDLYQVHWPSPVYSIQQMARMMARLQKKGWIRHIGVSNFNKWRTRKFQESLPSGELVANQVKYNLLEREPEESSLLTYLQEQNVTLIAYSPLAQGALSGKYTPSNLPPDFVRRLNPVFSRDNLGRIEPLIGVLKEIGGAHGRSPAMVGLNWLFSRKGVVAIPGAKSVGQAEENTRAMGWRLTEAETARIEKAYGEARIQLGLGQRLTRLAQSIFGGGRA